MNDIILHVTYMCRLSKKPTHMRTSRTAKSDIVLTQHCANKSAQQKADLFAQCWNYFLFSQHYLQCPRNGSPNFQPSVVSNFGIIVQLGTFI